jgi:nitrite reductase/ring-hydroxylating ferredoxin subunit
VSENDSSAQPRASRRAVFGGVVGLGVGVPLLAACGSGSSGSADGGSGSGGTSTTPSGAIGKTSDVPVGGGKIYAGDKVVVTQPTQGDFKAFSAVCTHQACILGEVSDGMIKCSGCHHSEFDITTGAVTKGPATKALPEKSITVSGDGITVT